MSTEVTFAPTYDHGRETLDARSTRLCALRPAEPDSALTRLTQGARIATETRSEEESHMRLSDARVEPAIAVTDMDRAKQFYEGKLGLSGGSDEEDGGYT
jgi:hypothetical protein